MAFDVVLHLGTLVAVFAFYWQDIMAMIRELFLWIGELIGINKSRYRWYDNEHRVMMVMLILATIPTAIIGFLFNDIFEKLFSSLRVVGFALLITGAILWLSNMMAKGRKEAKDIRATDAITIGLLQGLAITPGISRSGTTIFASMLRGFNVELATKFSFLLSIPSILGAAILEGGKALKLGQGIADTFPMIIGFLVAALSGYLAIRFLVDLIHRKKLYYFSYYCWGVGILIILYSLMLP